MTKNQMRVLCGSLYPVQIERKVPVGDTLRIGREIYTKAECGWTARDGRKVSSQTISTL